MWMIMQSLLVADDVNNEEVVTGIGAGGFVQIHVKWERRRRNFKRLLLFWDVTGHRLVVGY